MSPLGDVASYGYDAAGNVTSFVDPRGNELGANPDDYRWRETYDAADDLTSVTDPLGNETTLSYDPVGNLISRTDANGHVTGYTYDAANRLIAVTEPDNSVIHYVYDEVGNLIARTDALGRMTTYMYDAENRPVVVTSPAGKTWTLGYDADGNLISMRTPSGGTIGYAHDSLGRVVQVSYSDGTPSVSYTYDAAGNRVSMTDGSGTVRYAYDRLNRLVSVDASAHRQDGAADSSASYLYEPSGNVTDRNIAGAKVSYSYNADGRLASVKTTKPGKKAVVLETDYSYDAAGNLIGTTLPNGVVEARSYDRAGRLTSIHATNPNGVSVFGVDYTLDPAGNPTRAVFDKPSGAERDESYSYDPLGRLIAYCATAGCKGKNKIAYTYDLAGDRLTETIGKKTTAYAYDPDSELLSQTLPDGTKLPYSYDANGNETQAGPWSYSYNLANELIQATNGSTSAAYSYDGDGNRLTEQVSGSTPQTTRYLWDQNFGLPQLAGTQDGSGSTLASFIYGNGPLAMIDVSGAYRYYTTDELGSIRATTGPAGGVRDRGSYQPFGEALANGGGAITNDSKPLAFTGQYLDPVTGLYDMRARNYDSSTGRFQSPDPLGAIDSPEESQYGYARNDPTSFVDPSGMGAVGDSPTCTALQAIGLVEGGAYNSGKGLGLSDSAAGRLMHSSDPAVRSGAAKVLGGAERSSLARSSLYKVAGVSVAAVNAYLSYEEAICNGRGSAYAAVSAYNSTAGGTLGATIIGIPCAAGEIASAGLLSYVCGVAVPAGGIAGSVAGEKVTSLLWDPSYEYGGAAIYWLSGG